MLQTGPTGRTPLVLSESGANQEQVQVCLMKNELAGKTDFEQMNLTASLTVSDDERRAGELVVIHLLLHDVLLQGSCLSELRRLQRSSAHRL